MSFNIWCDHPRHPAWKLRRTAALGILRYHRPELIGGQEFMLSQLRDIAEALPEYRWVGVGREDGHEAGEFAPIFYRHERLELVENGCFWLAPNTAQPGKGWDAACPRIVTWARFVDRETRRSFVHFNTHFDHFGSKARRESARLILHEIESRAAGLPAILTGDLNCLESSVPYAILTGKAAGENPPGKLQDTLRCCQFPPLGPRKTWGGFLPGKITSARLDYIFVSTGVTVLQHAVLTDRGHDGRYPSDHHPVVAEIRIGD